MLDSCTTRGRAELATGFGRQGEQSLQLRRQLAFEAREVAQLRRVFRLEARCDLGEAGVTSDQRRDAGRGGLRGDHPKRLREDRRHNRDVAERKEMDEVAVLERPREEGALRRLPSSVSR